MQSTTARDDGRESKDSYREAWFDLTAFQRDLLAAISDHGNAKGLALKDYLADMGYGTVNHGRLYPNLDTLVEADMVTKAERDKRTNDYSLTHRGERILWAGREWLHPAVGLAMSEEVSAGLNRQTTNSEADQ